MKKKARYTNTILGIKVDCIHNAKVLEKVTTWMREDKRRYIVTPNPEIVMQAQDDQEFMRALNQADMAIPDGVGLVWVLKWRGFRKVERVTGADLMNKLIAKASQYGYRVFLLGGYAGVASKAAERLKDKYPKLKIQAETGPLNIEKVTKKQNLVLRRKINKFKPHLLLVAYGAGKQETWIAKNLRFLSVRVAMGVGGSFDYLVKPYLRAPKWVQWLDLEWLWRLVVQPWRVKRQLALIKFVGLVLRS